jgi:acyl carrier protein
MLEVKERIKAEINHILNDNRSISDTEQLVINGVLNSVKIVTLAGWLEQEFGLDFAENGFNVYDLNSINAIYDLIERSKDKN